MPAFRQHRANSSHAPKQVAEMAVDRDPSTERQLSLAMVSSGKLTPLSANWFGKSLQS